MDDDKIIQFLNDLTALSHKYSIGINDIGLLGPCGLPSGPRGRRVKGKKANKHDHAVTIEQPSFFQQRIKK